MRILITGAVVLVIWSFLSMWLYVDHLKPAAKKKVIVQPPQETISREADSLAKLYASMPKDLVFHYEFDELKFMDDPDMEGRIAEFKSWIEKYPATTMTITGHTDFIGTPEYNIKLGQDRAEIVMKYLAEKGIPAEKLTARSMGEDQPIGSHITREGRAKNRRTEVTINK